MYTQKFVDSPEGRSMTREAELQARLLEGPNAAAILSIVMTTYSTDADNNLGTGYARSSAQPEVFEVAGSETKGSVGSEPTAPISFFEAHQGHADLFVGNRKTWVSGYDADMYRMLTASCKAGRGVSPHTVPEIFTKAGKLRTRGASQHKRGPRVSATMPSGRSKARLLNWVCARSGLGSDELAHKTHAELRIFAKQFEG